MARGLFLTLEGLDGSGKTTQINRLAAWLGKRGHALVLTRQPGGTATGERIRALALDSRSTFLAPMAEMALMFADRAQAIAEVIEPALAAGKIVLCDRFTDSTEAYQGGGRELGSAAVLELHRLLCGNLAEQSGTDEGRFEQEKDAFYRRVWQTYQQIAAREPERVVLIEGDLSIDEVHEQIVEAVAERLAVRASAAAEQS